MFSLSFAVVHHWLSQYCVFYIFYGFVKCLTVPPQLFFTHSYETISLKKLCCLKRATKLKWTVLDNLKTFRIKDVANVNNTTFIQINIHTCIYSKLAKGSKKTFLPLLKENRFFNSWKKLNTSKS